MASKGYVGVRIPTRQAKKIDTDVKPLLSSAVLTKYAE